MRNRRPEGWQNGRIVLPKVTWKAYAPLRSATPKTSSTQAGPENISATRKLKTITWSMHSISILGHWASRNSALRNTHLNLVGLNGSPSPTD